MSSNLTASAKYTKALTRVRAFCVTSCRKINDRHTVRDFRHRHRHRREDRRDLDRDCRRLACQHRRVDRPGLDHGCHRDLRCASARRTESLDCHRPMRNPTGMSEHCQDGRKAGGGTPNGYRRLKTCCHTGCQHCHGEVRLHPDRHGVDRHLDPLHREGRLDHRDPDRDRPKACPLRRRVDPFRRHLEHTSCGTTLGYLPATSDLSRDVA